MSSKNLLPGRLFTPGNLLPFILVTTLFFLWGIPNNLNDVLIKQFMKSFELTRFQAGLIQSAFYMGYFVLAMPAALVMKKYGYKTGLVTGLLLYSLGCLLFWPAAHLQAYGFFLFALFVIASGLAFLETGANPFIAVLGDPASSERRLNFSQAFNPIGSITGVLIGTVFIFSGIEHDETRVAAMKLSGEYGQYLRHETMRVVVPYLILAGVTLVMAILILRTRFPEVNEGEHDEKKQQGRRFRDLFSHSHFVKGVIAQFFYVGAQVGTWSYFIQYTQDYTGQDEKTAGYFLTGTLVAFMLGRFSATWLMRHIRPNKLMGIYALVNVGLVLLSILLPGWVGVWAIFLTSFFMSLMFPTIFALGIKGLGSFTKIGGSMIVMAIIGGAIWTPVMGLIAQTTGSMALAMIVPLLAYLVIGWYAFRGSIPKLSPVENI